MKTLKQTLVALAALGILSLGCTPASARVRYSVSFGSPGYGYYAPYAYGYPGYGYYGYYPGYYDPYYVPYYGYGYGYGGLGFTYFSGGGHDHHDGGHDHGHGGHHGH